MLCKNCRNELGTFKAKRNGKIVDIKKWRCEKCNPYLYNTKSNPYNPSTHYPQYKARVYQIMRRNPEKIIILRECSCKTQRKIKHHPDYEKPFEVELLCFSCHWKAHEKIEPGFNNKDKNGAYTFLNSKKFLQDTVFQACL